MADAQIAGKKVPKPVLFIGGGTAGLLLFIWWRKRQAANAAAAAPADASSTDTSGTSTDQSGLPAGSGGFFYDPATGQYDLTSPYGGGPFNTQATAATNAQWAQAAESQLQGIVNESALSAALGKYLTGQPMTDSQKNLADQAIAVEGYPPVSGPNGYPPAMHSASPGGSGQGNKHKVKVPNVLGMEYAAAASKLAKADLKARRAPGQKVVFFVIHQTPSAGTEVAKGTTVTLQGVPSRN